MLTTRPQLTTNHILMPIAVGICSVKQAYKCAVWGGRPGLWLWEKTRVQEVVGLNPSNQY